MKDAALYVAMACQVLLGAIAIRRINGDIYGTWDTYLPAYAAVALMPLIIVAMLLGRLGT